MTDLTTATPATSSKSKTSIDHTLNLAELKERTVEPPRMEPMPRASLSAIAAANLKRKIILPKAEVLKLTARHPYDPAGLMDFYQPGRWDSTSDLVFMSSIVTGPEPGMWDGTAGYVQCAAPADGDYLIVVHFTGYQQTMRIDGPWGTAPGHTASTSDAGSHRPVAAMVNRARQRAPSQAVRRPRRQAATSVRSCWISRRKR